jgi:hypothetical protein
MQNLTSYYISCLWLRYHTGGRLKCVKTPLFALVQQEYSSHNENKIPKVFFAAGLLSQASESSAIVEQLINASKFGFKKNLNYVIVICF